MTNKDVPYSQSSVYDLLVTFENLGRTISAYQWPKWNKEEWKDSVEQMKNVWDANGISDYVNIL